MLLLSSIIAEPFSILRFGACCLSAIHRTSNVIVETICSHPIKSCLIGAATTCAALVVARNTILHYSCRHNKPHLADLALTLGADPNKKDAQGMAPIHILANYNSDEAASTIFNLAHDYPDLQIDIDMAQQNNQGLTPLTIAAQKGSTKFVEKYLQHIYFNPNQLTASNFQEALFAALEAGHSAIALRIIQATPQNKLQAIREQYSMPNQQGLPPLIIAVQKGYTDVTTALLRTAHIDPTTIYKDPNTQQEKNALVVAFEQKNEAMVKIILEASPQNSYEQQSALITDKSDLANLTKIIEEIKAQRSAYINAAHNPEGPLADYTGCATIHQRLQSIFQ